MSSRTKSRALQWKRLSVRKVPQLLRRARQIPSLRRLGPRARSWNMDIEVVGSAQMKRLNLKYRRKNRATDVLSFPAHPIFFERGHLGALVICAPVMERQAHEYGHAPEVELEILLAHGLVHLLGLDHEKSAREARLQSRLETQLRISSRTKTPAGLIARGRSGKP